MLCCVLDSNWREVEDALDILVSQEREVATGDSQKGIHNDSVRSVYVSGIAWGVWIFGVMEAEVSTSTLTEAYTRRSMM